MKHAHTEQDRDVGKCQKRAEAECMLLQIVCVPNVAGRNHLLEQPRRLEIQCTKICWHECHGPTPICCQSQGGCGSTATNIRPMIFFCITGAHITQLEIVLCTSHFSAIRTQVLHFDAKAGAGTWRGMKVGE